MESPFSSGTLVAIISSFGNPIIDCPPAIILCSVWKKMKVLNEYYEGWTYTILWDGNIERHVAHEWIEEI